MTSPTPATELDARFSAKDATATDWADGRAALAEAQAYWLSTVRADGRPHVTPLLAVWSDDALHFCTGPDEQKAKNLEHSPYVVLTTGTNALDDAVDVVVEGAAVRLTDEEALRGLAKAWEEKYTSAWHFDVQDGCFRHSDGGRAYVFRVAPSKAFGFVKGDQSGQTRWLFES